MGTIAQAVTQLLCPHPFLSTLSPAQTQCPDPTPLLPAGDRRVPLLGPGDESRLLSLAKR